MEFVYKLSEAFHQDRRQELFKRLSDTDLDLLMVFDATTMAYLTGFFHMTTERPIGLGFAADGSVFALTTELEIDQLRGKAPWLDDIDTYFDYPEGDWNWIADRLVDRGYAGKRVGLDMANLVMSDAVEGYETIKARLGDGVRNAHRLLVELRLIKHPEEIALMRLGSKYCDYLVGVGFDSLKVGVTEYEVHRMAEDAVIRKMLAELPEIIDFNGYARGLVFGRSLFGGSSSLPHGPKGTAVLQPDTVVMITYGTAVCNYIGETERSGFFGRRRPIDEKRFQVMVECQDAGMEAIKPGVRCCDVWEAVKQVAVKHGMEDALRHHAGHGKGLETHEHPYLDAGDETVLDAGMMFSCEPGLYFPGEAGFRHSDTILVTETGYERLTHYPRDIDSLTVPVR
ncbi:MAG: Xaa-Pro peptidase family protein [Anaerolineae bacterium]|jgi:Xaa-Pro aminopeptidase